MTEKIGDRFCHLVDADRDAFNFVHLHAAREIGFREARFGALRMA